MNTDLLDHPAVFIMVSSGTPSSFAFEAPAALVLWALNDKSMPACCKSNFTQRDTVCLDTGP